MMYQIHIDEYFELEFEQIIDDILTNYSEDYANKITKLLQKSVSLLRTEPRIYAVYADIAIFRKFLIDGKFIVFYTIDDKEKIVHLVHIFPAMRDLPSLLS